jgi:hypothetical protein
MRAASALSDQCYLCLSAAKFGPAPKYNPSASTYNFQALLRLVPSIPSAITRTKELETMSAQKTISKLSFAVIALFIAAIPCFAQTEAVAVRAEQATAVSLNSKDELAAVNRVWRTDSYRSESAVVADARRSQKQPAFSATKFMQAVGESVSLETSLETGSNPTIVLNNFETPKFDVERTASKRITFVPSKGQSSIPQ